MDRSLDQMREIIHGDFTYLVDEDFSACLCKGHPDGERVMTLPESVELEGKTFRIKSVEIGAYSNEAYLEELFIPDSYEFLDEDSFHGCKKLKTVHIGKGLKRYGKWSFNGCPLECVDIDPENPFIRMSDDGGSILSKDGRIMIYNVIPHEKLSVQEGVEVLSSCAISCNSITTEITFPESLGKLDSNSIFQCSRVERLIFKEGLREASLQSLSYNDSLVEIDFPSTFQKLGFEAIAGDMNLKKIILRSSSVVEIETDTMKDYPTGTCRLIVPAGLMDDYRKHPSWGRFQCIESL